MLNHFKIWVKHVGDWECCIFEISHEIEKNTTGCGKTCRRKMGSSCCKKKANSKIINSDGWRNIENATHTSCCLIHWMETLTCTCDIWFMLVGRVCLQHTHTRASDRPREKKVHYYLHNWVVLMGPTSEWGKSVLAYVYQCQYAKSELKACESKGIYCNAWLKTRNARQKSMRGWKWNNRKIYVKWLYAFANYFFNDDETRLFCLLKRIICRAISASLSKRS